MAKPLPKTGVVNVRYTKSDQTITERVIIPTNTNVNISALDVSDLDINQQQEIAKLYQQFISEQTNFISWLHDNHPESAYDLKWRTFKPDSLEIL